MPDLPAAPPPILTLRAPRASERALLDLARAFRLKASERAGTISRDGAIFRYAEGPFDLTLYRASGAFRFKDRTRWQIDHRSHVELSDEDAVSLARAHLRRYRLLPADARVLRVSRLHVAAAGPERKIEDHRVIDVAVCLQPTVRGVPLDGPGGKVTVYLDHEGKMTGLDHVSRRIGPVYKPVPRLHPPDRALDEARRSWERRGVPDVEVREVRFCYFEAGWNDVQRYLQPAYIVLATLFGSDPRIRMNDIYVTPAAVNHVGRIVAAAPAKRGAQRPREDPGASSGPR